MVQAAQVTLLDLMPPKGIRNYKVTNLLKGCKWGCSGNANRYDLEALSSSHMLRYNSRTFESTPKPRGRRLASISFATSA